MEWIIAWLKEEWAVIKQAPATIFLCTVLLTGLFSTVIYHVFRVNLEMKADLLASYKEREQLKSSPEKKDDEQNKKIPQGMKIPGGTEAHFKIVENRIFKNEDIPLDGYSYINCRFENVSFFYNGDLAQLINVNIIYPVGIKTNNPQVQRVLEVFQMIGALNRELQISQETTRL